MGGEADAGSQGEAILGQDPRRWLGLVLGLGVLVRLHALTLPADVLLQRFIVDDLFYYLEIARNVVAGNGVVFNQGIPTNGFHPLHVLLLIPLVALLRPLGLDAPVHGTLALGAAANLATGVVLYHLGREVEGPRAGLLAAALWVLGPYVAAVHLTGLDTPVYALVLATLAWFVATRDDPARPSGREALVLGGLVGLLFLARLDGALFGLTLALGLLARRVRAADGGWRDLARDPPRRLVGAGLVALAAAAAWLVWSQVVVGHPLPVSGRSVRALRLRRGTRWGHALGAAATALRSLARPFAYVYDLRLVGLVLAAFVAAPAAVLARRRPRSLRDLLARLDWLLGGVVLWILFYALVALGIRLWYQIVPMLVVTVLGAFLLARAARLHPHPKAGSAVAAAVLLAAAVSAPLVAATDHAPQERLKREAVEAASDRLPPEATLAAFNTGVFDWYTPHRDVLNLDGVVSTPAHEAIVEGTTGRYMERKNVTHVLDKPRYVATYIDGDQARLTPVANYTATYEKPALQGLTLGTETLEQRYVLYRVRYPGG